MPLEKEKDRYLLLVQTFESFFQIAKDLETLPLSFFSKMRDHLNLLGEELNKLEYLQGQLAVEKANEIVLESLKENVEVENETIVIVEEEVVLEEPELVSFEKQVTVGFLSDEIGKKIYADFRTSLTLNDKFRFQRDLFRNDAGKMNEALDYLNSLDSMDKALSYLNNFDWNWEDESVQAFKEILEKRFD